MTNPLEISPGPAAVAYRLTRAAAVIGLVFTTACGSTVLLNDTREQCQEDPTPQGPVPQSLQLRVREAGTFVGEQLHLHATVDGVEQYLVAEIVDGVVFVVATPASLSGSAQLLPLEDDTYLRLHSPDGQLQVDVVDTSAPRQPVLAHQHPVEGVAAAAMQHTATIVDGHLMFCHQYDAEAEPDLAMIDFAAPAEPGSMLSPAGPNPCGDNFDGAAATSRGWASWTLGDGYAVPQVTSFQLGLQSVTGSGSFGFNASGSHNYGNIVSGGTNGSTTVINTESANWFLVFPQDGFGPKGPYHNFAFGGPKHLLTVTSTMAYFATSSGVRAYDISDPKEPVASDYHAEISLEPQATTFVAANDTLFLVADQQGQLYVLRRDQSGPVEPARVFAGVPEGHAPVEAQCPPE